MALLVRGDSLLHFSPLKRKFHERVTVKNLLSGISAAIQHCVYIWLSLSKMTGFKSWFDSLAWKLTESWLVDICRSISLFTFLTRLSNYNATFLRLSLCQSNAQNHLPLFLGHQESRERIKRNGKTGRRGGWGNFCKTDAQHFCLPPPPHFHLQPCPPLSPDLWQSNKVDFYAFLRRAVSSSNPVCLFLFLHSFLSSFDICLSFYALHPAVSLFSPLSQTSNNFGTTLAAIVTPLRSLHLDAIRASFL